MSGIWLNIIFYSVSVIIMLAALMVVLSKNPVQAVFFLILVFLGSAILLLILGLDFTAIIFIVIYVGAIAVLFLFVIMMLNIRLVELEQTYLQYIPLGGLIVLLVYFELYISSKVIFENEQLTDLNDFFYVISYYIGRLQIENIADLLYTYYFIEFIIAGVILLVAMVGAILLTLNHKLDVRRQEIYRQAGRSSVITKVK